MKITPANNPKNMQNSLKIKFAADKIKFNAEKNMFAKIRSLLISINIAV